MKPKIHHAASVNEGCDMGIKMFVMRLFTRMKVYLGRSNTYLTIINSMSILFLATEKIKDYGFNLTVGYQVMIAITMFATLLFIGWLDTHFGLYKMETKMCSDNNPQVVETLEIVKRIEGRIK